MYNIEPDMQFCQVWHQVYHREVFGMFKLQLQLQLHVFDVKQKNIFVAGETVFFPQVPVQFMSKSGKTLKFSNEIIHELQVRSSLASEQA